MRDDLMVQQQVANAWQHMVGVICLNQTGRKKVKEILPEFFKKFPGPFLLALQDVSSNTIIIILIINVPCNLLV